MTTTLRSVLVGLLLCAAVQTMVRAQALYSRDAKITVSPNTTLTVRGDVENEGTIRNNGHLRVAGPWVNSGKYEAGQGEITFNSSTSTIPQIIHHNGQSFNRVTITGGTKKVLLSDVVIEKEIHFHSGIVEEAGNSKIIFGDGVLINGASDSSHVNGVVFHRGSGRKVFPIGSGLTYLPVELVDVKDASAVIGVQAMEFGGTNLSVPSGLEAISRDRYWHVDIASGSIPDSPIILPLEDFSWTDDARKVVVVQSESMTERFTSIGRSETVDDDNGRIKSELNVSLPFVALATEAATAEIVVYNAVSANGDERNDYLRIENIKNYLPNRLTIFNRWGDKVFEIENYDNEARVFRGKANIGRDEELVSGTYFYVLDIRVGESIRGFITVKN